MAKKMPYCLLCGQYGHYKSFCFRNPSRKYALRRKYSAYKRGVKPKGDKLLSNEKSLDRRRLIMELDRLCSLIVRVEASDKYGVATCFICKKRLPYKQMQNGHYRSRQFQGTRFDFDNMRCCCITCNVVLHGNLAKYRESLVKEIGEERVNALDQKKNKKISTPELEELLKEMKSRYKALVEEKKKSLYN